MITLILSLIIHFASLAAVVILLYFYFKQKKSLQTYTESTPEGVTDEKVFEKLKQALENLQLKPKVEEGEEAGLLHVDYQNAHFIFNFKDAKTQGIDIIFPFFYKEKVDYVDAMRAFCNRLNSFHGSIVASYLTNEDYLYINASANMSAYLSVKQLEAQFITLANNFFSYQREFTTSLIEELNKLKKYDVFDFEYNECCDQKMKQLLLESTVNAEQETYLLPDDFLENKNRLSIGDMIEELHFFDPMKLTHMEVITGHNIFSCDMPEQVRNYKVCTPLLGCEHPADDLKAFVRNEAVYKLYYTEQLNPEVSQSATERILYVMLQAAEATPHTLYYKATLCHPDKKLANTPLPSLHESLHDAPAITLLLGYELQTPNQQKAEFDFMYKDIDDKIAEGHSNDLTPEQLLIFGITNPDAAFYSYWGKRFIRQGRYLEAVIRFNQAWNILNLDFENLKKNEKKTFYEISSLIGLCLYKMNMPKTALYYYHLASEIENTYYFSMTIKCMIAANDPSCLKYIDNSLNETKNQISELLEDEDDLPEMLTRLYHFLRRAKVQACYRRNLLDEAEEVCKELAEENVNSDFAMFYLKMINDHRQKK